MLSYEVKRFTRLTDGEVVSDNVMVKKNYKDSSSEYFFIPVEDVPEVIKLLQELKLN